MPATSDLRTNATQTIESGDDRYLPGYEKGLNSYGPRLIETRVAFSLYGAAIPYTLGRRRMAGNIIWSRPLEEKTVVSTTFNQSTTLFGYFATFAVSFGYNGNADAADFAIRRAWANGTLIIDNVNRSRAVAPSVQYRFYNGTQTEADETMVAYEGAANVPAYKDQVYMVFVDLPLGSFDNKIPMITVEIEDVNSSAVDRVDMTGVSGDASNGFMQIDWDRMRAWVENSGDLYIYDLGAGAYLRTQVTSPGIDSAFVYLPWLQKILTAESGLSIDEPYHLLNPDNGINLSTIPDGVLDQCFNIAVGSYTKLDGSTWGLAITKSQYSTRGVIAIDPAGAQISYLGELTGVSYHKDDSAIAVGKNETFSTFYAYTSKDTDLVRIGVPKTYIENPLITSTITEEVTWYAYDGAGSPTFIDHIVSYRTPGGVNALIIFYDNAEVILLDEDTKTVLWRNTGLTHAPILTARIQNALSNADMSAGFLIWDSVGGHVTELNLSTGTEEIFTVNSGWVDGGGIGHSPSRSIVSRTLVGGGISRIFYKQASGASLSLTTLIEQVARLAGYNEATEIDVSVDVDQAILGAMLVETTSLEEILDGLRTLFGLEIIESDGTLKVTDRLRNDTTNDFTFTQDDIVQTSPGQSAFTWRQEDELALPREYKVTYLDASLGYQWASQVFGRSNIDNTNYSDNTNEITVPLVLTAAEAKKAAARALYTAWNTSTTFEFQLPKEFLGLEVGDILGATVDDYSGKQMRVTEVSYNDDLSMNVVATSFQAWEDLNVEAFAGTAYDPVIPSYSSHKVFVIDAFWPPRTLTGDRNNKIVSLLMLPPDPAVSYTDPGRFFVGSESGEIRDLGAPAAVAPLPWGYLTTEVHCLPGVQSETWDPITQLNVNIVGGDASLLTTATLAQVFEGSNLAAIGNAGGWELIGFSDVTLEIDGSYTFSNLVRGQYYTYAAMRQLANLLWATPWRQFEEWRNNRLSWTGVGKDGDYFVLLDADFVDLKQITLQEYWYAGVDLPSQAEGAMEFQGAINKEGKALPCHVTTVTRDSDGLVTINYEPTYYNQRSLGDGVDPAFDILACENAEITCDILFVEDPDALFDYENPEHRWDNAERAALETYYDYNIGANWFQTGWYTPGYVFPKNDRVVENPYKFRPFKAGGQYGFTDPSTFGYLEQYNNYDSYADRFYGSQYLNSYYGAWDLQTNFGNVTLGGIFGVGGLICYKELAAKVDRRPNFPKYWNINIVEAGYGLQIDEANNKVTFDEPLLRYALSNEYTTGYGLNVMRFYSAVDKGEVAHELLPLNAAMVGDRGMTFDKLWVAVYREGGQKKWQLMQIDQV